MISTPLRSEVTQLYAHANAFCKQSVRQNTYDLFDNANMETDFTLLCDRLKYATQRRGLRMAQIADRLGKSRSTIQRWYDGSARTLSSDVLAPLAEILGVDQAWLASGRGDPTFFDTPASTSPPIPVHASPALYRTPEDLGDGYVWIDQVDAKLSAGDGVVEWIVREERQVAFRENWFKYKRLNQESCKLLSVKGRSMEPMLEDGDVVLIDLSDNQPEDGEVYAVNHNGKLLIKQLVHSENGIEMRSFNVAFEPVPIKPTDHFQVIGRKVWRGG